MAKRRSARLLEKEEKAKKANLSSAEPIVQDSPVFDPKNRPVFSQIINNLDSSSFVRLARTCKEMNYFCFNNMEIKIPCWTAGEEKFRYLEMGVYHGKENRFWYDLVLKDLNVSKYLEFDRWYTKNMASMPFVYTLKRLVIHSMVTYRVLKALRTWLERHFSWVLIQEIEMAGLENCWDEMAKFVQEAGVVRLSAFGLTTEASREVLSYLTKTLTFFVYEHHIDDDIILEATAKTMRLYGSKMSMDTFKELVKKFIAGEIFDWTIERDERLDDDRDSFFEAISEVMKTVTVMDIDRNTMESSVIYRIYDYGIFYYLRPDGELIRFTVGSLVVHFEGV